VVIGRSSSGYGRRQAVQDFFAHGRAVNGHGHVEHGSGFVVGRADGPGGHGVGRGVARQASVAAIGHQVGPQQGAHECHRVVEVAPVDPIGLPVIADVEAERVAHDAGEVRFRQAVEVVQGEHGLLGGVQRKDAVDCTAGETGLGCFGVDTGVPLAGRGRVAAHRQRAPHPDHLARAAGEVNPVLGGRGHVRQRSGGHDRHLPRMAGEMRFYVAGGRDGGEIGGLQRRLLPAQLGVAGSGRPVSLGRRPQPAGQRPRGTDADRDVAASHHLEQRSGVAGHVLELDVAGHAGHPPQVQLRGGGRDEQRHHVVDPGIDVQDHRAPVIGGLRHRSHPTPASSRPGPPSRPVAGPAPR
jgi:hypothetical protein